MSANDNINIWTASFSCQKRESGFRDYVADENLRANKRSLLILLPLYTAYAIIDVNTLQDPIVAVAIRLTAALTIFTALIALQSRSFAKHHEIISATVCLIAGAAISLIIWREPSLDNSYYVGLIQGGVIVSFLFRIRFTISVISLSITLFAFFFALIGKEAVDQATLQFFIIFTMYSLCAFGIYFFQIYQRKDFVKAQLIAKQNVKLEGMLNEARSENERRIAALNLLVHFVKTPIHQINGFSDVVLNSLSQNDGCASIEDGYEGAKYIKTATANLNKSVSGLLTYHRLDENKNRSRVQSVSIDFLLDDFRDLLPRETSFTFNGNGGDLNTIETTVHSAFEALAAYYIAKEVDELDISINVSDVDNGKCISIIDNLEPIGADSFENQTKPLTKIDNYLNFTGSEIPMTLRTVARAVELADGKFWRRIDANKNVFEIWFPNIKSVNTAA